MLLGVPFAAFQTPLAASEALFMSPLGGLGADVAALAEAYWEEADAEPYVPARLVVLDQALFPNVRASAFAMTYQKGKCKSLPGQFSNRLDEYQAGLREGDWQKVDHHQMELAEVIAATPGPLWGKIMGNIEQKRSWALTGGLFLTTQNPVVALQGVLGDGQSPEGLKNTR
jgi:hypothetical protein